MASKLVTALSVAAVGASSVIVNDFDSGATYSGGAGEGWYKACGINSYGNREVDFHMDYAGEKGEVTVSVKAPLAEAGCYLVEEHHPGGASCSPYLPFAAPLTVHSADGSEAVFAINQAVNGGAWNAVGSFELSPDQDVHLVFSNGGGGAGTCQASVCWWLADAWRFTWTGADCASASPASTSVDGAAATSTAAPPECADFEDELEALLEGPCGGATTCDADEYASGHACRVGTAALAEKYEYVTARCLLAADDALVARGAEVEAALACPEANAAAEDDGAVATADEAVAFDGDCSNFKTFADQVVDKCSRARCCADVVEDDECRYYSAGLHALYPGAMAFCAHMVRLDRACTCFVRQVSACSLQGEIHEILYGEQWQPTCSEFPAMAYQQDNAVLTAAADDGDGDTDTRDTSTKHTTILAALLAVAVCVALVASGVACRLKRRIKILALETARAPVAASVTDEPAQVAHVLYDDKKAKADVEQAAVDQGDVEEANLEVAAAIEPTPVTPVAAAASEPNKPDDDIPVINA